MHVVPEHPPEYPGTKGLFVEHTEQGTRLVVVFQEWGRHGELVIPLPRKRLVQLVNTLQRGLLVKSKGVS